MPELEEQSGDPGVVVGARPAGLGVLPGQERRELARVDARVVVGYAVGVRGAGRRGAQGVADRGELPVGQLQQPGRQGEPAVEVARVLVRHRALVADVVLELRPRVLQHRADLHLRRVPAHQLVGRMALACGIEADQQVPAGVAEPSLLRGLLAHVAVVVDDHLVAQQVGHGRHVAVHVGDHADADRVGDLAERVGVEGYAVAGPPRLLRERRHGLRPAGDAQVVDAGVVEDAGHQREELLAGSDPCRVLGGVLAHGVGRDGGSLGRSRAGGQCRREGRGDDVAGLEVAVRRDVVGRAWRR